MVSGAIPCPAAAHNAARYNRAAPQPLLNRLARKPAVAW